MSVSPRGPCGRKISLRVERMKDLLIVKVYTEGATVKVRGFRRAVVLVSKGQKWRFSVKAISKEPVRFP